MNLSGPLLVVGAPLAMAALLQAFRRWTGMMAWLAAAVAAGVGFLLALAPPAQPVTLGNFSVTLAEPQFILGRAMVIEPVDRLPLVFIFMTAAALFILGWRLLPHSNFFPAGLAMVALLAAALMAQQVVYSALLVEMAALLAIFPLHEPVVDAEGRRYGGTTKGGAQYMAYVSLALPGLMITQLLLEQFAIFPSDLGLLRSSTVLLGFSFAILLGAVPFQSWLSTVATDGSPPVVTFLFTVNLGTVWFMLLAYLEAYTWLSAQASFGPLFTNVGLLMMAAGGLLAAGQRRLGRIVGYATLVDNGAMFVALGTGKTAGLALTVMLLIARPLALGLMTLGLDGLRRLGRGADTTTALEGAAWQVPWRTLAFVMGGIGMAGFPLSLNFTARWGLYRLLAASNMFRAVTALAGSAGVMMGLISAMRTLLSPRARQEGGESPREDPVTLVLIVILLGVTVALGLFPQVVSHVALEMAQGFTFFTE